MTGLRALYQDVGLSYRQIGAATGFSASHVWRVVQGKRPRASRDAEAIRAFLRSQVRPPTSRDPEFLAQIRQVAVPFLESRLVAQAPVLSGLEGPPAVIIAEQP